MICRTSEKIKYYLIVGKLAMATCAPISEMEILQEI